MATVEARLYRIEYEACKAGSYPAGAVEFILSENSIFIRTLEGDSKIEFKILDEFFFQGEEKDGLIKFLTNNPIADQPENTR